MTATLLALLLLQAPTGVGAAPAPADAIALVNGQALSESHLDPNLRLSIAAMELKTHLMRVDGLEAAMTLLLLEAEAKRVGLSLTEYFTKEIDAKIKVPTDAQIDEFWKLNAASAPKGSTKQGMRGDITRALMGQERRRLLDEKAGVMIEAAKVELLLQPPRVGLDLARGPSKGAENAPITIVEFSNYACSHCAELEPMIETLMRRHPDKIRLVARDFSSEEKNPEAHGAARAARCASMQDRFWEYRSRLFESKQLGAPALLTHADELGLDMDAFNQCLVDNPLESEIVGDTRVAEAMGLPGTPWLIVNGRHVVQEASMGLLEQVFKEEWARLSEKATN